MDTRHTKHFRKGRRVFFFFRPISISCEDAVMTEVDVVGAKEKEERNDCLS